MVKIEKIEGSKVTLVTKHEVDRDNDDLKSLAIEIRLTIDIVELFNEVTKKELPDFLKPLIEKLGTK